MEGVGKGVGKGFFTEDLASEQALAPQETVHVALKF